MTTTTRNDAGKPLRILTIDNGGLQAMSILRILKAVCDNLSKAEGSNRKAPHELFDIIAGIGTGGWLAILLGRYKLNIDQCMAVYIKVVNAINPNDKQSIPKNTPDGPVAVNQDTLIAKIDKIIAEYGLSPYMTNSDELEESVTQRRCYAFAVGVVKSSSEQPEPTKQDYHLFRAYNPPENDSARPGPAPATCEVSKVCAATGAAKLFLQSCAIDGMKYWDRTFPETHSVTDLALDETVALFGEQRARGLVLNISPGTPTRKQIDDLRRAAKSNTTRTIRVTNQLKRVLSFAGPRDLTEHRRNTLFHQATYPQYQHTFTLLRAESDSSTSSTSTAVSENEKEYQRRIRDRLQATPDGDKIYHRLEPKVTSDNPYLNDVEQSEHCMRLMDEFLSEPETQDIMNHISVCCSKPSRIERSCSLDTNVTPAANNVAVRSSTV